MPTKTIRQQAVESDLAPLYALAGLTDLVAEKVTSTIRTRLTESQQQASERFAALKSQPGELERQAKLSVDELTTFLRTLPVQLRDFPTQARTQLAVLQHQAEAYRSTAETAYAQFAGRGKTAVDEAIGTARKSAGRVQSKGKDAWEDATDAATEAVTEATDDVLGRAQETVTAARRRATGRTATPTVTPRSSVKAARTSAAKAPAKKTPAKKAPTKSPAAKSTAGKSAASESTASKSTASTATAKKTSAKKAPAKKA